MPMSFHLCMDSTSYGFPFGMEFQAINQYLGQKNRVRCLVFEVGSEVRPPTACHAEAIVRSLDSHVSLTR